MPRRPTKIRTAVRARENGEKREEKKKKGGESGEKRRNPGGFFASNFEEAGQSNLHHLTSHIT